MSEPYSAEKDVLRAAGYHVERQGTYDNRMKRLAILESQLRWAEDEKEHHEKWLSGILDESRRLRDRFNRITAALATSGVEWSVIADLIGDDTRDRTGRGLTDREAAGHCPPPPAQCSCAMTEGSQRRCTVHGEDAYILPPGGSDA